MWPRFAGAADVRAQASSAKDSLRGHDVGGLLGVGEALHELASELEQSNLGVGQSSED